MISVRMFFILSLLIYTFAGTAATGALWNQANLLFSRARYLPSPKREEALDRSISSQCRTPECVKELATMIVYLDFKERLKSTDRKGAALMLDRLTKLQSVVVRTCGASEQCRTAEITSLCRFYSETTPIVQKFCEANYFVSQFVLLQNNKREERFEP